MPAKFASLVSKGILSSRNSRRVRRLIVYESGSYRRVGPCSGVVRRESATRQFDLSRFRRRKPISSRACRSTFAVSLIAHKIRPAEIRRCSQTLRISGRKELEIAPTATISGKCTTSQCERDTLTTRSFSTSVCTAPWIFLLFLRLRVTRFFA